MSLMAALVNGFGRPLGKRPGGTATEVPDTGETPALPAAAPVAPGKVSTLKKDAPKLLASLVKGRGDSQPGAGAAQGDVKLSPAEEHHRAASAHFEEGRKLWNQRNAMKAPTPQHYKAGIGLYIASLLAGALDPTRQAGSSLLEAGQQSGQDKLDESNGAQAAGFQRRQQALGDQGTLAFQQAQQEQNLSGQAASDANDQAARQQQQSNTDRQFGLEQGKADEAATRDQDRQIEADFNGYLKAAASTDPGLRKLGLSGAAQHLGHNRAALERLGYNVDDLQRQIIDASGNKTPAQLLQEALAGEHVAGTDAKKATTAKTEALTPVEVEKTKAEIGRIRTATGLDETKAKEINTKLQWLPIEERAKTAEIGARIESIHARIAKEKSFNPNDKDLRKTMSGVDERIKSYDRLTGQLISQQRELMPLVKKHDQVAAAKSAALDKSIASYRNLRQHLESKATELIQLVASKHSAG